MKHEKMTLKEAFNLVKSKRSIARPNPKFVESLLVILLLNDKKIKIN